MRAPALLSPAAAQVPAVEGPVWEVPSTPGSRKQQLRVATAALRTFQRAAQSGVSPFYPPCGEHASQLAADYFGEAAARLASSSGSGRGGGSSTAAAPAAVPAAAEVRRLAEEYAACALRLGDAAGSSLRRCDTHTQGCLGFGPERLFVPFLMSFNASCGECAACFVRRRSKQGKS